MTREIEVHAFAEIIGAENRLQHADDFGALLVNRRGVEIVDGDVGLRLHRMGERPRILLELAQAQILHVGDPAHRVAAHVAGEPGLAEDRQAFLQRKLEPVAAGDAVARPIVEIFVADHRFDAGVIVVGGGLGRGQQHLVVEDVEALVLHGAEIERRDRDDHENVEVVFAAVGLLVPAHGTLERIHRICGAVFIAVLDIDAQIDLAARERGVAVANVCARSPATSAKR